METNPRTPSIQKNNLGNQVKVDINKVTYNEPDQNSNKCRPEHPKQKQENKTKIKHPKHIEKVLNIDEIEFQINLNDASSRNECRPSDEELNNGTCHLDARSRIYTKVIPLEKIHDQLDQTETKLKTVHEIEQLEAGNVEGIIKVTRENHGFSESQVLDEPTQLPCKEITSVEKKNHKRGTQKNFRILVVALLFSSFVFLCGPMAVVKSWYALRPDTVPVNALVVTNITLFRSSNSISL